MILLKEQRPRYSAKRRPLDEFSRGIIDKYNPYRKNIWGIVSLVYRENPHFAAANKEPFQDLLLNIHLQIKAMEAQESSLAVSRDFITYQLNKFLHKQLWTRAFEETPKLIIRGQEYQGAAAKIGSKNSPGHEFNVLRVRERIKEIERYYRPAEKERIQERGFSEKTIRRQAEIPAGIIEKQTAVLSRNIYQYQLGPQTRGRETTVTAGSPGDREAVLTLIYPRYYQGESPAVLKKENSKAALPGSMKHRAGIGMASIEKLRQLNRLQAASRVRKAGEEKSPGPLERMIRQYQLLWIERKGETPESGKAAGGSQARIYPGNKREEAFRAGEKQERQISPASRWLELIYQKEAGKPEKVLRQTDNGLRERIKEIERYYRPAEKERIQERGFSEKTIGRQAEIPAGIIEKQTAVLSRNIYQYQLGPQTRGRETTVTAGSPGDREAVLTLIYPWYYQGESPAVLKKENSKAALPGSMKHRAGIGMASIEKLRQQLSIKSLQGKRGGTTAENLSKIKSRKIAANIIRRKQPQIPRTGNNFLLTLKNPLLTQAPGWQYPDTPIFLESLQVSAPEQLINAGYNHKYTTAVNFPGQNGDSLILPRHKGFYPPGSRAQAGVHGSRPLDLGPFRDLDYRRDSVQVEGSKSLSSEDTVSLKKPLETKLNIVEEMPQSQHISTVEIKKIANRVYNEVLEKMKFERQRRGF